MIYYYWTNIKSKHAGQELKVSQKQGRGKSENVSTGWERFVPPLPFKGADHAPFKQLSRPACCRMVLQLGWFILCSNNKSGKHFVEGIVVYDNFILSVLVFMLGQLKRHQCCGPGSRARSCSLLLEGRLDFWTSWMCCSETERHKPQVTWPVFVCRMERAIYVLKL